MSKDGSPSLTLNKELLIKNFRLPVCSKPLEIKTHGWLLFKKKIQKTSAICFGIIEDPKFLRSVAAVC